MRRVKKGDLDLIPINPYSSNPPSSDTILIGLTRPTQKRLLAKKKATEGTSNLTRAAMSPGGYGLLKRRIRGFRIQM